MPLFAKTDDNGWLQVLKADGKTLDLCEYTRVEVQQKKSGRTYFKVLDGPNQGLTCSLADGNASTYLSKSAPAPAEAILKVKYGVLKNGWYSKARKEFIDQQMAKLRFSSEAVDVSLNSIWGYGTIRYGSQSSMATTPGTFMWATSRRGA